MLTLLLSPDDQNFIEAKIRAGEYASAEDLVYDAIAKLRSADDDQMDCSLTPEDIAAIEEAEKSIDRGEAIPLDTIAPALRQKYCGQ